MLNFIFTKVAWKSGYLRWLNVKREKTLLKERLRHRCFPVNFPKCLRTLFFIEHHRWLLLIIFCNFGHVHEYQTQFCISRKLKKSFLWIASLYLNSRRWNFSNRTKPWLHKCLLRCHLQIFIQGRVMLKNNSVYSLALCANLPCKIEKFEWKVVGVGILGIGICFNGSH